MAAQTSKITADLTLFDFTVTPSLASQRFHWIDVGGATCGEPARHERDEDEQK